MQQDAKGFTLIELVLVIIISGIVTAFISSKFINLSSDAHIAMVKQLHAKLIGQTRTFHIKQQLQGKLDGAQPAQVQGQLVYSVNGYPHVKNEPIGDMGQGIAYLLGLNEQEYDIERLPITDADKTQIIIYPKNTRQKESCFISYTEALQEMSKPTIAMDYSGC